MGIRIGLALPGGVTDSNLRLAKQAGFDEICTRVRTEQRYDAWEFLPTLHLKKRIEDAGLKWTVVETLGTSNAIKLGLAGRDEHIENLCTTIRSLGAAGIPTAVYTWTAMQGWLRTSTTTLVRGGALATSYDHELMQKAPPTVAGTVPQDLLWETLEYFLKAVIPVAEEAGVRMAMHPDDPPLSPIRDVGRIMISPEGFQRLIDLVPSPSNGITFCQGCFSEMGCDPPSAIKRFSEQGKIFFAHFRNLTGTAEKFTEQFHDDGDIDMYEVLKAFTEAGYDGAMRPDHVPTMEGEAHSRPGYSLMGKVFAVGYMKGLMEGIAKAG